MKFGELPKNLDNEPNGIENTEPASREMANFRNEEERIFENSKGTESIEEALGLVTKVVGKINSNPEARKKMEKILEGRKEFKEAA